MDTLSSSHRSLPRKLVLSIVMASAVIVGAFQVPLAPANAQPAFDTAAICSGVLTPIHQIQGSTDTSPLVGTTVTIQGVVVGDYEGPSPNLRGFFLEDVTPDSDPATSEGIFIFNNSNDSVANGQVVEVTGAVSEFQGQTQVSSTAIVSCGTTATPTPIDITLPVPAPVNGVAFLERYEGMLARFPQTLFVTEHFQLGRFGQVVMSSDGRLRQPTSNVVPGSAALAQQAANDLNQIIVDDQLNAQNPDPILFGRSGNQLSASNTLRGADTATGIVGILNYTWAGNVASSNSYRLRPINALGGGAPSFQAANPRPATPAPVGGTLRVSAANLLNYFNTFGANACTNGVNGTATDCRGADNAAEFARQNAKTVAAIIGMNADVIGIMEMENDGYGPTSAIQDLIDRLNAATSAGTYAFIQADANTSQINALGTDAIKVGIIYKPGKVTPVGTTAVLNIGAFGQYTIVGGGTTGRNRPALAQAFSENATGQRFILVPNHLKSKGSACDDNISPVPSDPDIGDGQGNCNQTRLKAAQELVAWLATNPTSTGDPDILIVGDMNSYAKENPITAITGAGYTNLIESLIGADGYSYVFDGQWGYLDHMLASNSLAAQVSGITEWHINADEPNVLDYNTNFKSIGQQTALYAADQYRASDHDPVIVGLTLGTIQPRNKIALPLIVR